MCVRECVSVHMCIFVHMLVSTSALTFVVGGVVNTEISVPNDGQLHRKAAHLHPIIEILSPWQPEGERERARQTEREAVKLSIIS